MGDEALGVCQNKRPRHLECAESTASDVRGRDPNVTEQAGTRPATLPTSIGPRDIPSHRDQAKPTAWPRPCAHASSARRQDQIRRKTVLTTCSSTPPRPASRQNGLPRVLTGHRTLHSGPVLWVAMSQRTPDPTLRGLFARCGVPPNGDWQPSN